MKILIKQTSEIKPNTYNPNTIDEKKFTALVENIKKFGYLQPILIDDKNTIIDGEHRWKAAQAAGMDKIQCVIYQGNGDIKEYRKLLTLSMNNLRGENTEDAFEDVIKELAFKMDYEDIEKYTGFDVNMIRDIVQGFDATIIPEDEVARLDEKKKVECPECGAEFVPN